MYSILHISDLHRAIRDYVSNDELISALVADREHYQTEDPPIRAPDAIIVSGDIIQGAVGSDTDSEIGKQYEVARSFLEELTGKFVGGDKARVILVPGNHDVDWATSRKAMSLVSAHDAPIDLKVEPLLHAL